jgi:hypothetical protein
LTPSCGSCAWVIVWTFDCGASCCWSDDAIFIRLGFGIWKKIRCFKKKMFHALPQFNDPFAPYISAYSNMMKLVNKSMRGLNLSHGMLCLTGQQPVLKRRLCDYYGKLSALSCVLTVATRWHLGCNNLPYIAQKPYRGNSWRVWDSSSLSWAIVAFCWHASDIWHYGCELITKRTI